MAEEQATLNKIADTIAERGHAKGVYIDDETGACCVLGGLYLVEHPDTDDPDDKLVSEWRWVIDRRTRPIEAVLEELAFASSYNSVVMWSDKTPTRELLAQLRGAP